MAKSIIILGQISKILFMPFLLAFTQIIYIIFIGFYPEKENDTVVHGIVLSLSQMYIKLFPLILKIDNKDKINKNMPTTKKFFRYFLLGALFLFDGILVFAVDILQTILKDKKETFTATNLFPHNDFILMSIEMIFLVFISICLLKYKYFKHHIISLIIFTIFGIICEAILYNYDDIDWAFILIKFISILEVGVNATYVCYQKYLMEKFYFPYWNVAFVPGVVMLVGICILFIVVLTDSNRENSSIEVVADFYSFYTQTDIGLKIGKLIIYLVLYVIMCPLSILIIYNFTPNFILIIFQLSGITKKLIETPTDKLYCIIFYIIQFIALMIHLEILELNFCGLNKYTKRNIELRGDDDLYFHGRDSSLGNVTIDINDDYLIETNNNIEMKEKINK